MFILYIFYLQYSIVNSFFVYKKILNNIESLENDPNKEYCSSNKNRHSQLMPNDYDELCPSVLKYLNDIAAYDNNIIDSACKYLYCWIYFESSVRGKNADYIFAIYRAFLSISNEYHDDKFKEYMNKIDENTLKKLNDLYNMHINLDNIKGKEGKCTENKCNCAKTCSEKYMSYKNTCNQTDETNFCDEIEKVRNKYNNLINSVGQCDEAEKSLPSFKAFDTMFNVLVPLILGLVLFFTLFILYKVNNHIIYYYTYFIINT
ncbi:hypothetical protein PVBG_05603 [Plasmodium vivax Brazil I]|uniref:Variable surface protein n=1 Tax=Plasmodium vivax (strain Brazil I) TaxID=1033975 RepID=A0A0J9SLC3_PLAV1|nr:hypothetical protein PVBG_05603 [Plasmodium vivax Brazil I]